MLILGISGKRGTGKSTLANSLRNRAGFEEISLAAPLKEMVRRDLGLTIDQTDGPFKEAPTQYRRTDGSFFTPRDIMIRVGTLYRSFDPQFWVKKAFSNLTDGGLYVVSDVRFANECNAIKELGGLLVRIDRSQDLNIFKAALDDLSETELDAWGKWDFKLDARDNKNISDLTRFADSIVSAIVRSSR